MSRYFVVNTIHSVHTRAARRRSPGRGRMKQYILGGSVRLVRGRPVEITQQNLLDHYDELWKSSLNGCLQVREGSPEGPVLKFGEKEESTSEQEESTSEQEESTSEQKTEEPEDSHSFDEPAPAKMEFPIPPAPTTRRKRKGKSKE